MPTKTAEALREFLIEHKALKQFYIGITNYPIDQHSTLTRYVLSVSFRWVDCNILSLDNNLPSIPWSTLSDMWKRRCAYLDEHLILDTEYFRPSKINILLKHLKE